MKSIYDTMTDAELAEQSVADWAFHFRGVDLNNIKRARIHRQLLDEGGTYTAVLPGRNSHGEPTTQERVYGEYSSPPEKMLQAFDEDEQKHWFPELYQLKEEGKFFAREHRKESSDVPYGKRSVLRIMMGAGQVSFQYHYWPGCCAMSMVSSLDTWGPFRHDDAVMDAVAKRIVPMMRYLMGTHQVMFAYSDEEVESQDPTWKAWGGVDIQTPFDSYKTGNAIHTASIDLVNAHDVIEARERREHNDNQRDDYDDDGDM